MSRPFLILTLVVVALSASAKESADRWFEVKSEHFVVLTDTNEKQARHLADQFERMRAVFHLLLPSASDSNEQPIVVLALKDKKAMQSLEPAAYLAKGQIDLAGLFLEAQNKNYILLRLDAEGEHPYATVYHEYTHFMLRKANDWLPLWLNEGLAEFYQNTEIRDKDVLLGQASSNDILYLRQNTAIPLLTLLKVDHNSPYYHQEEKGSVFYAESWALTHMIEITDRQKGVDRLHEYATLLAAKEDPIVAAQKAFGDLNLLQRALNNYLSQAQFMMFKMNKTITVDDSTFQLAQPSTTDVDTIRADVLIDTGRNKEALELIESVLRTDPNNASAHETMGNFRYRAGDLQAAQKWYGEAVQLKSQSYLAYYYYAVLPTSQPVNNSEMEASLKSCIQLNPSYAPAYDALARRYSEDGKSDEAHAMNVQAIFFDPGNVNYRLNAASVLMNAHRYDDAVRVLKAASKVVSTPEQRDMLQSRLDEIQHYQSALAHNQGAAKGPTRDLTAPAVTDTRTFTVTSADGRQSVLRADDASAAPKYPTEEPSGPHHTAKGILRAVHCSYPTILTLKVESSGKAPAVSLYRNDFYKIDFTVLNFTPKGDINPCTDIEGLNAKVEYTEVSDKSIAGQILSIELSK